MVLPRGIWNLSEKKLNKKHEVWVNKSEETRKILKLKEK